MPLREARVIAIIIINAVDDGPSGRIRRARRYKLSMSSALRAELMSPEERLHEVAEILGLGLSRLITKQSSRLSADLRDSSLDCAGHQSGDPNALNGGLGSDR